MKATSIEGKLYMGAKRSALMYNLEQVGFRVADYFQHFTSGYPSEYVNPSMQKFFMQSGLRSGLDLGINIICMIVFPPKKLVGKDLHDLERDLQPYK